MAGARPGVSVPAGDAVDRAQHGPCVAQAVASAGLEDVMFHTLRLTAAHTDGPGVPVTGTSAQLGHVNASVTQSIYSHVLPGMQEEAARRLAAVPG